MFRLIVATLAALYGILYAFGDVDRRPSEVSRKGDTGFDLFPAATLAEVDAAPRVLITTLSEREAVDLALAAGRAARASKAAVPPTISEPEALEVVETTDAVQYWYVTGSRVNLRGGPSTSDAIVGQATLGMEAEVLSDLYGWYEIRLADGSGSGWIFGEFLTNQRPG